MVLCAGHTRITKKPCRGQALTGKTKCWLHGGLSPSGIAHYRYTMGRQSKYIPKHLKQDYEAAVTDPELLSLQSQAALLQTREYELLRRMEQEPAPPWGLVTEAMREYEKQREDGTQEEEDEALDALKILAEAGLDAQRHYEQNWIKLQELIQQKVKVSQAENKRLELIGGWVKVDSVIAVLMAMLNSVKESVTDRKALQHIQDTFNRVVNFEGARAAQKAVVVDVEVADTAAPASPPAEPPARTD